MLLQTQVYLLQMEVGNLKRCLDTEIDSNIHNIYGSSAIF